MIISKRQPTCAFFKLKCPFGQSPYQLWSRHDKRQPVIVSALFMIANIKRVITDANGITICQDYREPWEGMAAEINNVLIRCYCRKVPA